MKAALIRWSLVVVGLPFLVVPFLAGIYGESIQPLRLRRSHTVDMLEEDYRELMALDPGPRSRRLREYAEEMGGSNRE
jgi:hypothetical protein